MSGLLLLPAVVFGASVLLFATTHLERMIGLRSSRWPLPSDIDLVPLVVSVNGLRAQPAVQVDDNARPHRANRTTREETQWASS